MPKRKQARSSTPTAHPRPSRGGRSVPATQPVAEKGRNPALTLAGRTVTGRTSTGRSAGRAADLTPPPAPTARAGAAKTAVRIRRRAAPAAPGLSALRKSQLEAEAAIQDVTEAPESGCGRGESPALARDQDESGAQGLAEPLADVAAEPAPAPPRQRQGARPRRRPRS